MYKILTFFLVSFLLGRGTVAFAQYSDVLSFDGGVGYFMPTEKVKDKYGMGQLMPSVGLKFGISPKWSIGSDIGYWSGSKDETIYNGQVKNSLRIIPLDISGIYNFPARGNFFPYIGGGLSLNFAEKKASGSYMESEDIKEPEEHKVLISESDSETALGFHGIVGVDYFLRKHFAFSIQTKYSYAPAWDMDIGGLEISAVVKVFLTPAEQISPTQTSTTTTEGICSPEIPYESIFPKGSLKYEYAKKLDKYLEESNGMVKVDKNKKEEVLSKVEVKIDKAKCDKANAVATTTREPWHGLWGITIYLSDIPCSLQPHNLLDEYIHAAADLGDAGAKEDDEHLFFDYIKELRVWGMRYGKPNATVARDRAHELLKDKGLADKLEALEKATGLGLGEYKLSK